MMGACTQPANLMIIMEYMHNGSVDGLIHGKKKNFLSLDQRIHMARDCCLGMVRFFASPILLRQLRIDSTLFLLHRTGCTK
jgi:hypothetical protein